MVKSHMAILIQWLTELLFTLFYLRRGCLLQNHGTERPQSLTMSMHQFVLLSSIILLQCCWGVFSISLVKESSFKFKGMCFYVVILLYSTILLKRFQSLSLGNNLLPFKACRLVSKAISHRVNGVYVMQILVADLSGVGIEGVSVTNISSSKTQ